MEVQRYKEVSLQRKISAKLGLMIRIVANLLQKVWFLLFY